MLLEAAPVLTRWALSSMKQQGTTQKFAQQKIVAESFGLLADFWTVHNQVHNPCRTLCKFCAGRTKRYVHCFSNSVCCITTCGFEYTAPDMRHRSPIASRVLHSDMLPCFAIHDPCTCLSLIDFQKVSDGNAMHSMGAYGSQEPRTTMILENNPVNI